MNLAVVVIGRNEGPRLLRCFESLSGIADRIIYVDSGSTDNSVTEARARGIDVISLDLSVPFTAARARNEGIAMLGEEFRYVQTIDGDCEIQPGWLNTACNFLDNNPKVAGVAGRLRERHPEATIWNRLADDEWDVPKGETEEVGGIALLRCAAVAEVGGYREDLIAGEEPEMCLRLRRAGWQIWRLDDEMAWHDIAMTRFSQWWLRAKRAGYAYAEGAALHGASSDLYRVRETRRILFWGILVPIAATLGAVFLTPWALALLFLLPLQVLRLALRGVPIRRAFFLTLGKTPEAQGLIVYWKNRIIGRQRSLIEYK